jgi:hypothetical protein
MPSASPQEPAIAVILAWTAIIVASALWNIHLVRQSTFQLAYAEAICSLDKDMVYRRWVAGHGGVYVPVTRDTLLIHISPTSGIVTSRHRPDAH